MTMTPQEIGEFLDLPEEDIERAISKPSNALNSIKRKIRYFCFEKQRGNWAPDKLVKHMQRQEDFTSWENFAVDWDVTRKNPLQVRWRKFSIHEEWEAELRRVVPDLPLEPKYKQGQ